MHCTVICAASWRRFRATKVGTDDRWSSGSLPVEGMLPLVLTVVVWTVRTPLGTAACYVVHPRMYGVWQQGQLQKQTSTVGGCSNAQCSDLETLPLKATNSPWHKISSPSN